MWNILRQAGINPTPHRTGPTWVEFIRSQAAAVIATDFACVDTWHGTATLDFGESEHELLHRLAPREVLRGYRTSIAFTITGAEVRPVRPA